MNEINEILKPVMVELRKIMVRQDFRDLPNEYKEKFIKGLYILNQFQDDIIIEIINKEK